MGTFAGTVWLILKLDIQYCKVSISGVLSRLRSRSIFSMTFSPRATDLILNVIPSTSLLFARQNQGIFGMCIILLVFFQTWKQRLLFLTRIQTERFQKKSYEKSWRKQMSILTRNNWMNPCRESTLMVSYSILPYKGIGRCIKVISIQKGTKLCFWPFHRWFRIVNRTIIKETKVILLIFGNVVFLQSMEALLLWVVPSFLSVWWSFKGKWDLGWEGSWSLKGGWWELGWCWTKWMLILMRNNWMSSCRESILMVSIDYILVNIVIKFKTWPNMEIYPGIIFSPSTFY